MAIPNLHYATAAFAMQVKIVVKKIYSRWSCAGYMALVKRVRKIIQYRQLYSSWGYSVVYSLRCFVNQLKRQLYGKSGTTIRLVLPRSLMRFFNTQL